MLLIACNAAGKKQSMEQETFLGAEHDEVVSYQQLGFYSFGLAGSLTVSHTMHHSVEAPFMHFASR